MTETIRRRRPRYVVDRRFQMKYTILVVAVSSVVFCILGYFLYNQALTNTEILGVQRPEVSALIARADTKVLGLLAGFFLLQVGSLYVLGILLTHRIAGPLKRVQACLEEMSVSGTITPPSKIRSSDEFHEFFGVLQETLETLRFRGARERAAVEEALAHLKTGSDEALDKAKAALEAVTLPGQGPE